MKIKVIKIGGAVVEDASLLGKFAEDFVALPGPKVLVHGGGIKASSVARALGYKPVMIDGRRVTNADTFEVVTMVYSGLFNKNVVATLQKHGCDAIGLCGADARLITAKRREAEPVDYGYVGDVNADSIRVDKILGLLEAGLTPVF